MDFDKKKPSILLMHGSGLSHIVWSLHEQFYASQGFNVLSVDIPGHGNSDGSGQDVFFNISYSSLDFSGNRYIINAKEARNDKIVVENIFLKQIDATFYMKNDTTLKVYSNEGIYNNKTLDMTFEKNVKAFYEGSELFSEKAKFLNSESFLTISGNVIINDAKGTLAADQLLFDIEKQNLSIVSFDKNKVNANVNLQWKKVSEY